MNLPDPQRALLGALDDKEWKSVGSRLGPFRPGDAQLLVIEGLAEARPRDSKPGAHEYRRTDAGRRLLQKADAARGGRRPTKPHAMVPGHGD